MNPRIVVPLLAVGLLCWSGLAAPADEPVAWEYRAVAFGNDEKAGSDKLNELAAQGWEYVGPLANGLVAFKRSKVSEVAKELERLRGGWAAVKVGGKELPKGQWIELVFDGDRVLERGSQGGAAYAGESSLTIDPKREPRRIDFTPTQGALAGRPLLGIYTLDGDTLTICRARPGADRPREFAAKEGSGIELLTLQRLKAK